ncbi:MAG: DUF5655 domain-containing protein [Candidatus Shapirobacteria bacterium]|jgi:hypothetical protein
MWTCQICSRIFAKNSQPHSCRKVPLDFHFKGKEKALELFCILKKTIEEKIGKCQVISIPCCIHLFGNYDFLAALPKKDRLEIRFALDRILTDKRVKQTVPLSQHFYKDCIDIYSVDDIDDLVIGWLKESYHLKELK